MKEKKLLLFTLCHFTRVITSKVTNFVERVSI